MLGGSCESTDIETHMLGGSCESKCTPNEQPMEPEARPRSIHAVPDDVWRLIFGETALSLNIKPSSPLNTIKTSITLSHVCNHFRWVAINQAELWNRILIAVVVGDDQALFLNEELITLALKRTHQLPLVVDLRLDARSVHSQIAHYPASTWGLPFAQCLRSADGAMNRMETSVCGQYLGLVHMLCTQICSSYHVFQGLFSYFPRLEILRQVMYEMSMRPVRLNSLTVVKQEGMVLSWSRFEFHFGRLLYLEIGGPVTLQALAAILSSTNSLKTCILHDIWDCEALDDDVPSVNSIGLPALTELRIQGSRPIPRDSVSRILSLIAAPLLEVLFLVEWDWYRPHMINFVRKSSFKLKTLSLEGVSITPSELIEFLEFLPNLESLSFDTFFHLGDNIFFAHRMMARDLTHTNFQLCHRLRSMRIFYTCKANHHPPPNARTSKMVQITPISDMVERRLRDFKAVPWPSLREVRILQINPRTTSTKGGKATSSISEITRLLALREEGLAVTFELGPQGSDSA